MSALYEEYHRIIEQLVAGDAEPASESAGLAVQTGERTEESTGMRAAFIRVMKEELARLDKS